MDRNTILAIALSIAVVSIYSSYQASQRVASPEYTASRQEHDAPMEGDDARVIPLAEAAREAGSSQPSAPDVVRADAVPEREPVPPVESVPLWNGVIEGEHFRAKLTNRGAALTGWTLLDFSELDNGKAGEPIELVTLESESWSALTMPFEELGLGDLSNQVYRVESAGSDRVVFVLARGGLEIRKTYEFDLDGYRFELFVELTNGSDRRVAPDFAISWPAAVREGNDYTEESLIALHGEAELERERIPSVGKPGFFDRFLGGGDDEEEIWRDVSWAGVDLKYFASLLMPQPTEGTRVVFEPIESGESAVMVLRFAPTEIAPGQTVERHLTGFAGPKQPDLLEAMGRQLAKSVDLGYSWFEPLTRFFQWFLTACYGLIGNYGWSIIIITILVRGLMLPIMNRQMRSMEKMKALQPQLKEIQAEHSDDRQKQSEATMALYKESGVNPLGGCFPMLLQFPVFIGLFFALKSSFALRQAPFILWINDLSAPDLLFSLPGLDFPFRLLPIIMGASMVLQQKLTPTTVDPSQQTMMMVLMPVMMTVLFYQFPSGLVLYWMASNFLGIAHQLLVGRRMRAQAAEA